MDPAPASEPPANPEDSSAKAPSRLLRYGWIAAVSLLLAWPVGYLVVHRAFQRDVDVMAGSRPPQASAESITELEAAVRANPTETNRIRLSWAYLNGNEAGRAIPLLLSIVAEDRNNADAWNNLCVAHAETMRYNLAVEDCAQALRIAPNYQLAKNNLAWAMAEMQRTQRLISAEEQTGPAARDAEFYVGEGLNFLHIGSYDQAMQAWQRALQLDPRNAAAANDLGVASMFQNRPAQAMPWFQKAISLDPGMQLARNNLAWAKAELAKAPANPR